MIKSSVFSVEIPLRSRFTVAKAEGSINSEFITETTEPRNIKPDVSQLIHVPAVRVPVIQAIVQQVNRIDIDKLVNTSISFALMARMLSARKADREPADKLWNEIKDRYPNLDMAFTSEIEQHLDAGTQYYLLLITKLHLTFEFSVDNEGRVNVAYLSGYLSPDSHIVQSGVVDSCRVTKELIVDINKYFNVFSTQIDIPPEHFTTELDSFKAETVTMLQTLLADIELSQCYIELRTQNPQLAKCMTISYRA